MKASLFMLRNALQRLVGPVRLHRIRKRVFARRNTENGSCSYSDEWIYIYPTWACTLKCAYCQNLHATGIHNPSERRSMTPQAWADSVNDIGRNVVISGGDPFVYPHLSEVVNRIHSSLKVVICSDLSALGTVDVMRQITRPVALDASYHPCSGKAERFARTIELIRELGHVDITMHAVAASKSMKFLRRTQKQFSGRNLQLKLTPAYGELAYEGSRKAAREAVYCSKSNINVGPDGLRYPCLTKAIRMQDPLCSITDPTVTAPFLRHLCHDFGHCVPGDLEEVGMKIERVSMTASPS